MQRIATVLRQSSNISTWKKIEYLYTYAAFAAKDKKTRVTLNKKFIEKLQRPLPDDWTPTHVHNELE